MNKLIMTKGLPASGKTTWAQEEVLKSNGKIKRVNKDNLRAMIDGGKWSKDREKDILHVRDSLIAWYLVKGYDVIVDDTNLDAKHETRLIEIALLYNVAFEIKDFTDVPYSVCIERDMARPNKVGAKVIMRMYNQYLKPMPIGKDVSLIDAIICDIDGTIAIMGNRNPYDASTCMNDVVNEPIRDILYAVHNRVLENHKHILFVSGREDKYRQVTEQWLTQHDIDYDGLFMRRTGDKREDSIVKKEIFDKYIRWNYNIDFILDDRNRVVEMWRSLGLTCLQVADGNF